MNLQQSPTSTAERPHKRNESKARWRWLFLARTIWILIALIDLVTLVASIPAMAIQVHMACLDPTRAICSSYQLFPVQMAALQFFGISLHAYTAYTMIC